MTGRERRSLRRSELVILGGLSAVLILATALFFMREPAWDSPPGGFEEAGRERIQFRVFGGDYLTMPIGVLQNRCGSSAHAIKFRILGDGTVRVYRAGWNAFQLQGTEQLPVAIGEGALPADPEIEGDSGEMRFDHACEGPAFSGDPDEPDLLFDVVADIVYFSPTP